MTVDLASYKPLYLKTAREYNEKIKSAVALLQQNDNDTAAIESIYIAAHSLKSQSTIMSYQETGELCSIIESVFRLYKNNPQQVNHDIIKYVSEAAELIARELDSIEKNNSEIPSKELYDKIASIKIQ